MTTYVESGISSVSLACFIIPECRSGNSSAAVLSDLTQYKEVVCNVLSLRSAQYICLSHLEASILALQPNDPCSFHPHRHHRSRLVLPVSEAPLVSGLQPQFLCSAPSR
jgi:hypothetical protein